MNDGDTALLALLLIAALLTAGLTVADFVLRRRIRRLLGRRKDRS